MYEVKPRAASLAVALSLLALAMSSAAHAEGPGMRIVRDPVTGQLRAPTAEEFQAMDAQELKAKEAARAANASSVPAAAPVEVRRADGSVRLTLDDSQMSYAVVKRNADGALAEYCVTGEDAAGKVLSGKTSPAPKSSKVSKNAKEHSHDHE